MAASAPSRTQPFALPSHSVTRRLIPALVLPSRSLTARLRLLLADRTRFTRSLARESEVLKTAAAALLSSPIALFGSSAAPTLEDSLTGAWRLEAQITADLCESPITPLDGEDIRALTSAATAILEALDDLYAAAQLTTHAAEHPALAPLCRAALESVESVAEMLSNPMALASDHSLMPVLSSRDRELRTACRAAESAFFQNRAAADVPLLLEWTLIGSFRRLRSRLQTAICQTQRAVLKNS